MDTGIERIVIVGASLTGLRAAQALRDAGYTGALDIVGAEPHWPYDRPPLSKQILLGSQEPADITLEDPADLSTMATWHLGVRAEALDGVAKTVALDNGSVLPFDRLLIATGATPRSLPGSEGLAGVHTLRTLDDSLAIRSAFEDGARVVVIGAGFIGAEVAAAARSRGLDVVLLEALAAPLERAVGIDIGNACAELHRRHGVDVRCGVAVASLEGSGRVEAVVLGDGTRIPADLVVVGIGVRPETGWLDSSGIALDNGVVCDAFCESSIPGVFAAGDVARWWHPALREAIRVEHWTNAVEMGMAAAHNLLALPGEREEFAPHPYVWSDQYDVSIRYAGHSHNTDTVHILVGSLASLQFVAAFEREGRLAAVLSFDMGRAFTKFQRLLERGGSLEDANELAAATPVPAPKLVRND